MLREMNLAINVTTYETTDPRFATDVYRIFETANAAMKGDQYVGKTPKLYKNYNLDGLKLHEWVALSLYEDEHRNCIGFSSIIKREDIWGNGVRILNRFIKSKHYRFENNKRLLSNETKKMIEQQLKIAKELGYDFAFISRESNKKRNVLQHYLKYYNEVKWNYPSYRYKMFHTDDFLSSCWQHIAWTSFRPHIKDINIDNITEDEFIEFKKNRDNKD